MERNLYQQADCLTALAALPAQSVELCFADPPFNIGYVYDVYVDQKAEVDYLAWAAQWMTQVHRVLQPTGTFWLAMGDELAAEMKVLSKQLGFHCRSWVIWYYTFGVNCQKKFSRSHAHLFQLVKNPRQFTFNDHTIRVPSARQAIYGDKRAKAGGRLPDDTWILRPQEAAAGFTLDHDTWHVPRVAGTFKERAGFHGCQMPEEILARIIKCSSNPGDLVLDPFAGSATTLVVAKRLNRDYLGFDLSEAYVTQGCQRLAATIPDDGSPSPDA